MKFFRKILVLGAVGVFAAAVFGAGIANAADTCTYDVGYFQVKESSLIPCGSSAGDCNYFKIGGTPRQVFSSSCPPNKFINVQAVSQAWYGMYGSPYAGASTVLDLITGLYVRDYNSQPSSPTGPDYGNFQAMVRFIDCNYLGVCPKPVQYIFNNSASASTQLQVGQDNKFYLSAVANNQDQQNLGQGEFVQGGLVYTKAVKVPPAPGDYPLSVTTTLQGSYICPDGSQKTFDISDAPSYNSGQSAQFCVDGNNPFNSSNYYYHNCVPKAVSNVSKTTALCDDGTSANVSVNVITTPPADDGGAAVCLNSNPSLGNFGDPYIYLNSTPLSSATPGVPTTLNWFVKNAADCSIYVNDSLTPSAVSPLGKTPGSSFLALGLLPSGSISADKISGVNLQQGNKYVLKCSGLPACPNNEAQMLVSVAGSGNNNPPTVELKVKKNGTSDAPAPSVSIAAGQPIDLSWTTTNADACIASGSSGQWSGSKNPSGGTETIPSGSIPAPAASAYIYTLTCSNNSGSAQSSVSVSVRPILTVMKDGAGTGTVASAPAGISCGSGAGCSSDFAFNANVILTATPSAGSIFSGWSAGVCASQTASAGGGTCTVAMDASKAVIATFNLAFDYSLTKPADVVVFAGQAGSASFWVKLDAGTASPVSLAIFTSTFGASSVALSQTQVAPTTGGAPITITIPSDVFVGTYNFSVYGDLIDPTPNDNAQTFKLTVLPVPTGSVGRCALGNGVYNSDLAKNDAAAAVAWATVSGAAKYSLSYSYTDLLNSSHTGIIDANNAISYIQTALPIKTYVQYKVKALDSASQTIVESNPILQISSDQCPRLQTTCSITSPSFPTASANTGGISVPANENVTWSITPQSNVFYKWYDSLSVLISSKTSQNFTDTSASSVNGLVYKTQIVSSDLNANRVFGSTILPCPSVSFIPPPTITMEGNAPSCVLFNTAKLPDNATTAALSWASSPSSNSCVPSATYLSTGTQWREPNWLNSLSLAASGSANLTKAMTQPVVFTIQCPNTLSPSLSVGKASKTVGITPQAPILEDPIVSPSPTFTGASAITLKWSNKLSNGATSYRIWIDGSKWQTQNIYCPTDPASTEDCSYSETVSAGVLHSYQVYAVPDSASLSLGCSMNGSNVKAVLVPAGTFTATCSISPSANGINQPFTWNVSITPVNGYATYSYAWTGAAALGNDASSATMSYGAVGTQTAPSVTITGAPQGSTAGYSTTISCPAANVVNNPASCSLSALPRVVNYGVTPTVVSAVVTNVTDCVPSSVPSISSWNNFSVNPNAATAQTQTIPGSVLTSLSPTFNLSCNAKPGSQPSAPTCSTSVHVLPPAPTVSITPTPIPCGEADELSLLGFNISWPAVPLADGYLIYKDIDPAGNPNAAPYIASGDPRITCSAGTPGQCSFSDLGLSAGSLHTYYVVAYDIYGNGQSSLAASGIAPSVCIRAKCYATKNGAQVDSVLTGSAVVWKAEVTGGNPPYTFNWFGDAPHSSNSTSNLSSLSNSIVYTNSGASPITKNASVRVDAPNMPSTAASCSVDVVPIAPTCALTARKAGTNNSFTGGPLTLDYGEKPELKWVSNINSPPNPPGGNMIGGINLINTSSYTASQQSASDEFVGYVRDSLSGTPPGNDIQTIKNQILDSSTRFSIFCSDASWASSKSSSVDVLIGVRPVLNAAPSPTCGIPTLVSWLDSNGNLQTKTIYPATAALSWDKSTLADHYFLTWASSNTSPNDGYAQSGVATYGSATLTSSVGNLEPNQTYTFSLYAMTADEKIAAAYAPISILTQVQCPGASCAVASGGASSDTSISVPPSTNVTWTASGAGGSGSYAYHWTGDLPSPAPSSASFSQTSAVPAVKSVQVSVSSSGNPVGGSPTTFTSVVASCPSVGFGASGSCSISASSPFARYGDSAPTTFTRTLNNVICQSGATVPDGADAYSCWTLGIGCGSGSGNPSFYDWWANNVGGFGSPSYRRSMWSYFGWWGSLSSSDSVEINYLGTVAPYGNPQTSPETTFSLSCQPATGQALATPITCSKTIGILPSAPAYILSEPGPCAGATGQINIYWPAAEMAGVGSSIKYKVFRDPTWIIGPLGDLAPSGVYKTDLDSSSVFLDPGFGGARMWKFEDKGLAPNSKHTYAVVAVDKYGDSTPALGIPDKSNNRNGYAEEVARCLSVSCSGAADPINPNKIIWTADINYGPTSGSIDESSNSLSAWGQYEYNNAIYTNDAWTTSVFGAGIISLSYSPYRVLGPSDYAGGSSYINPLFTGLAGYASWSGDFTFSSPVIMKPWLTPISYTKMSQDTGNISSGYNFLGGGGGGSSITNPFTIFTSNWCGGTDTAPGKPCVVNIYPTNGVKTATFNLRLKAEGDDSSDFIYRDNFGGYYYFLGYNSFHHFYRPPAVTASCSVDIGAPSGDGAVKVSYAADPSVNITTAQVGLTDITNPSRNYVAFDPNAAPWSPVASGPQTVTISPGSDQGYALGVKTCTGNIDCSCDVASAASNSSTGVENISVSANKCTRVDFHYYPPSTPIISCSPLDASGNALPTTIDSSSNTVSYVNIDPDTGVSPPVKWTATVTNSPTAFTYNWTGDTIPKTADANGDNNQTLSHSAAYSAFGKYRAYVNVSAGGKTYTQDCGSVLALSGAPDFAIQADPIAIYANVYGITARDISSTKTKISAFTTGGFLDSIILTPAIKDLKTGTFLSPSALPDGKWNFVNIKLANGNAQYKITSHLTAPGSVSLSPRNFLTSNTYGDGSDFWIELDKTNPLPSGTYPMQIIGMDSNGNARIANINLIVRNIKPGFWEF